MCRFLSYIGRPRFMSELLFGFSNSLVSQAMAAREAKTEVNADGCGLGWYGDREEPGSYRSVLPAWSDPNFMPLARQIKSGLFMAHVRSATTGEVAYANCHPFVFGRHLFMHNGMITDYRKIRAGVEQMISDEIYENVKGSTDSEAIFHAALARGLTERPIVSILEVLLEIAAVQRQRIGKGRVRFSAMHSDGDYLWSYRWSTDNRPPTLYYCQVEGGTVIASEPFEDCRVYWREIPGDSAVRFDKDGAMEVFQLTRQAA